MNAQSLTHDAPDVVVPLSKTTSIIGTASVSLHLRLSGTAWDQWAYRRWAVLDARPEPWLTVTTPSGNATPPAVRGQDVVVPIDIFLDATGYPESQEAYVAQLHVDVFGLPTRANASIEVSMIVSSAVVPSMSLLDQVAPCLHCLAFPRLCSPSLALILCARAMHVSLL